MKKQLFLLMVCFSLIIPGSSFIANLQAQIKNKRTARTPVNQTKSQKNPSPLKLESVKKYISAKKSGTSNAGDPCSTAAPISFGQTVNGMLSTGDCLLDDDTLVDFYSFQGTAGQPIYISMSSGDFDTFLYLLDDTGGFVDLNDDSGAGTDSRIPAEGGVITLPYTGEFIIAANSFDPSTGNYSLSLNTDTTTCAATAISYNQTVNGTLATSDCAINIDGEPFYTDRYTFSGTAGQQISISMTSTAVDAYLILHSPTGDTSTDDNDSGGGTNARIPGTGTLTLTETGTYTIEASAFNSFEVGAYTLVLSGPTTVPVGPKQFDYDGDGKADLSIFRPSTGTWFIQNSGTPNFNIQSFGLAGDSLTPADFDGDGKTDIAVFRASEGRWYVYASQTLTTSVVNFGQAGDIPVPGDFDGDDKADYAIFRPSTGTWWFLQSSNLTVGTVIFGTNGDKPILGDFDGDGKNDFVVYRPSNNVWYRLNSTNLQVVAYQFGLATDLPTAADFDGDAKTDIAVYRPSDGTWYIVNSSNNSISIVNFGLAEDKPVPADYDGDGKADIAVFRPSSNVWYLLRSNAGFVAQIFGSTGDVPTPNAFVR